MHYEIEFYDPDSNDFSKLCDYVLKHAAYIAESTSWSFQRFVDWRYGHIEQENSFCCKTLIKFLDADGEILGIAINEDGRNFLTLLTTTDSPELYTSFLKDAIEKLMPDQESVYLELSEKQVMEKASLLSMGFGKVGGSKKMTYTLDSMEITAPTIKEGFRVVSMADEPLYEAQGRLRASAFQGKDPISDEELNERLRHIEIMRKSPTFNPFTDILVVDSDGFAVAGCEPLINFHTRDAEIERVCTHSRFRNQGFSRLVITEAMIRLKKEGIKRAYLSGWNETTIHLYQSFGPHETLDIEVFELKLK